MNFATIKYFDIANGPGVRTCLFVSGCTHRCPGCFNFEAWDFNAGDPFDQAVQDALVESLVPDYVDGMTILGGEPMEPSNQEALVEFLERVRKTYPEKSLWMYTGDTYEDLIDDKSARHTPYTNRILDVLDVLVDGKFVQKLYDITLRFRGSSNQRLIDLKKTREVGEVVLWSDEKIFSERRLER